MLLKPNNGRTCIHRRSLVNIEGYGGTCDTVGCAAKCTANKVIRNISMLLFCQMAVAQFRNANTVGTLCIEKKMFAILLHISANSAVSFVNSIRCREKAKWNHMKYFHFFDARKKKPGIQIYRYIYICLLECMTNKAK